MSRDICMSSVAAIIETPVTSGSACLPEPLTRNSHADAAQAAPSPASLSTKSENEAHITRNRAESRDGESNIPSVIWGGARNSPDRSARNGPERRRVGARRPAPLGDQTANAAAVAMLAGALHSWLAAGRAGHAVAKGARSNVGTLGRRRHPAGHGRAGCRPLQSRLMPACPLPAVCPSFSAIFSPFARRPRPAHHGSTASCHSMRLHTPRCRLQPTPGGPARRHTGLRAIRTGYGRPPPRSPPRGSCSIYRRDTFRPAGSGNRRRRRAAPTVQTGRAWHRRVRRTVATPTTGGRRRRGGGWGGRGGRKGGEGRERGGVPLGRECDFWHGSITDERNQALRLTEVTDSDEVHDEVSFFLIEIMCNNMRHI